MTDIIDELKGNALPFGQAYINLCERAAHEIERLRGEVVRLIALTEEAVSLVKDVKAERDAAFKMSRCECASDECCANLARLHAERDAAVKALTDVGVFLDHCVSARRWRDVQMNDFSFEWLERMIAAIDAAKGEA